MGENNKPTFTHTIIKENGLRKYTIIHNGYIVGKYNQIDTSGDTFELETIPEYIHLQDDMHKYIFDVEQKVYQALKEQEYD
jgi:hypothetical protein